MSELAGYFTSPVAYVFLVIFLLLTGFFTFSAGQFFERGEASLAAFFGWHPWLYLVLVPAVGMRVWAEARVEFAPWRDQRDQQHWRDIQRHDRGEQFHRFDH